MDTVNVLSKDLRTVIRKEVDFIPGAWVDFYDSVTTGTIRKARKAQEEDSLEISIEMLLEQIADWNFADGEKKVLPVTLESLDKLPIKLLTWIIEKQKEILTFQEDKKKEPEQAAPDGANQ